MAERTDSLMFVRPCKDATWIANLSSRGIRKTTLGESVALFPRRPLSLNATEYLLARIPTMRLLMLVPCRVAARAT